MIRQFRNKKADAWAHKADVLRAAAAELKAVHDEHVAGGGRVSMSTFDVYASAVGNAEYCERRADRWRP